MPSSRDDLDTLIRQRIYDSCLATGAPPSARDLGRRLSVESTAVLAAFERLAAAHILVLQPSGEVLMAMPFSAVPTPFVVRTAAWTAFANCGWDALGIAAMAAQPAAISTSCGDCGEGIALDVTNRVTSPAPALLHFALPVRRWWESVVFT